VRSRNLDVSWVGFSDPNAGLFQYEYALVTANLKHMIPFASLNPGSPAVSIFVENKQIEHGLVVQFKAVAHNFASAFSEILGSQIVFDLKPPECRSKFIIPSPPSFSITKCCSNLVLQQLCNIHLIFLSYRSAVDVVNGSLANVDFIKDLHTLNTLRFNLQCSDKPAGLKTVKLDVGTFPYGDDISTEALDSINTAPSLISSLGLRPGVRYYLTITVTDAAGWVTRCTTNGFTVDLVRVNVGFTCVHAACDL